MTPDRALRHLATWGLAGGPTHPIELAGTQGLASLAEFHRVTGVVLAAIADGAATDRPEDELIDELSLRHRRLVHSSLAAEADLVLVARRLSNSGVPFRVLKGCATAHLDHVDPALRLTSDVDLLVPADRLESATRAVADLVDVGRTVPDRRTAWTDRYGKDRSLALRTGGWLDLHRLLALGFHGLADDHDWFAGADLFRVADVEVAALAPEDRFVHALAHAGYGRGARLNSTRDVPVMLTTIDADWVDVVGRHRRWTGLLARGVDVVWRSFDLDRHPLRTWADTVRPSARERMALRTFEMQGSRQHWGGVLAVPPWKWPGLVVPIAVPSREYLAHYGRTPFTHLEGTLNRLRRRVVGGG